MVDTLSLPRINQQISMSMKEIKFEEIPYNWAVCYLEQCPWRQECLRYVAGKSVPHDVTQGQAVFPQALSAEGCLQKREIHNEELAWGFTHLYDAVTHNDYLNLRRQIENYLGSRYIYHRYHTGVKKLTVEQQAWIAQLFANYGYTEPIHFDHIQTTLIF